MSHVTRRHEQEVMENDPKTRIILYWSVNQFGVC